MGKFFITREIIDYIKSIAKDKTCMEITKMLEEKYNRKFNVRHIRKKLEENSIAHKKRAYKEKSKFYVLTKEQELYLKSMSHLDYKNLTNAFNEKFNLTLTIDQVRMNCYKKKLKKKRTVIGKPVTWSDEMIEHFKIIYKNTSREDIKEKMNEKFDLNLTTHQIKSALRKHGLITGLTGHFEKGKPSWLSGTKGIVKPNSGTFGVGRTPYKRELLEERLATNGYIEIKIKEPDVWVYKHRIVYEELNGPIPKDYCIIFANGNKQDLSKENLICVSKAEQILLNVNGFRFEDIELTKTGINIIKLLNKIKEVKNKG